MLMSTAEDEAERVTDGVEEDMEACFAGGGNTRGAEGEHGWFCYVDVVNPDVDVYLLRVARVRPARRHPLGGALEGEASVAVFGTDDDPRPVFDVLVDLVSQDRRVEQGQLARLRTVDNGLLHPTDHAQ